MQRVQSVRGWGKGGGGRVLNKVLSQVVQALYEMSACINLFLFAYIISLGEKNKSLYAKCNKYALIVINAI